MADDFDLDKSVCDLSEDLLDFAEVWMRQKGFSENDRDALFTTCITTIFYTGLSELDKKGRREMLDYVIKGCEMIDRIEKA